MPEIVVETVAADIIAAVHVPVRMGEVASAWRGPLDQVWAFLESHPELRRPEGHNVFLYHHPAHRSDPMQVAFGVQVARAFADEGAVRCASTPVGEVASAVHRGAYDSMGQTHAAIHAWCAANGREIGDQSWETYGDWNDDPAQLETTIRYLLQP